MIAAVENFPKPVLAALHGNAPGRRPGGRPGCPLSLRRTRHTAGPARGQPRPAARRRGHQRLPRLVGVEPALDMMTGGRPSLQATPWNWACSITCWGHRCTQRRPGLRATAAGAGPWHAPPAPGLAAPSTADFFDKYRAAIARKSRGLIAPGYIVELVEFACRHDIDRGQALERERFIECRNSPQSAALRHVFFAERACAKLTGIPVNTRAVPVKTVAVIGAGTMGGGIAMFRQCRDTGNPGGNQPGNLDRGLAVVRKNYDTSVRRGRCSQQQVDAILANITGTTEYADIAGVDLVIEAVFENMAVKQEVFRTLDATCKADCILATNTSYLDVNAIAAATGRPQQVVRALFQPRQRDETAGSGARGTDRARGAADVYATGKKRSARSRWRWACVTALSATACSGLRPPGPVLLLEGRQPRAGRRRHGSLGHGYGTARRGDLAGWISATARAATRTRRAARQRSQPWPTPWWKWSAFGQKSGAGYRYDRQPAPAIPTPGRGADRGHCSAVAGLQAPSVMTKLSIASPGPDQRGRRHPGRGHRRPSGRRGYRLPQWLRLPEMARRPNVPRGQPGAGHGCRQLGALRELTADLLEPAPLLVELAGKAGRWRPSAGRQSRDASGAPLRTR